MSFASSYSKYSGGIVRLKLTSSHQMILCVGSRRTNDVIVLTRAINTTRFMHAYDYTSLEYLEYEASLYVMNEALRSAAHCISQIG